MKSFLLFAAATSLVASQAFAAQSSSDDAPPAKLPTKLPKAVKKKKTKLNFEENSGTHVTTVIVRTPLPLDKALEDQNHAAHEVMVISSAKPVTTPDLAAAAIAPEPAPEEQLPHYHVLPPPPTTEPSKLRRVFIDESVLVKTETITPPPKAPAEATAAAAAMPTVEETAQAPSTTVSAQPSTPEPMGPPPPAPEMATATTTPAVSAPPAASNSTPELFLATSLNPRPAESVNRLYVRNSYLTAHYSEIDSHLDNGARGLALGWARQFGEFEGRASLEFGYAQNQEISVQNTRYLVARGDGIYFFRSNLVRPFAGFGLGVGSFDVRDQRPSARPNDLLFREYANGTAAIVSPSTGVRFDFTSFAIDLSLEYLAVIGAGSTSALGGWAGALSLFFPF